MEIKKSAKETQAFLSLSYQLPPQYLIFLVDAFLKGLSQQLHSSFHGNQELLGLFYWQILQAITLKFYGKSFNQRLGLLCIMNYMKEGSQNFHMNFSEK